MTDSPGPVPASAAGADELLEIACQEFVELVTEHLEGTLPEHLARAVRAHLALCDHCTEYLDQMRRTTAALRTLPSPTLPPAVRDELLEVFTRLHPDADDRPRP